jgi:F1F0 ATPase subunit 2
MTGLDTATGLLGLVGAFVAGGATGLAYFAGLWLTVRALPSARRPAFLVFGSYMVRLAVAGAVFVLVVRVGGWAWVASALAGFVLARMVMVRVLPSDTMAPGDAR